MIASQGAIDAGEQCLRNDSGLISWVTKELDFFIVVFVIGRKVYDEPEASLVSSLQPHKLTRLHVRPSNPLWDHLTTNNMILEYTVCRLSKRAKLESLPCWEKGGRDACGSNDL